MGCTCRWRVMAAAAAAAAAAAVCMHHPEEMFSAARPQLLLSVITCVTTWLAVAVSPCRARWRVRHPI
jgi:hypothetical protein